MYQVIKSRGSRDDGSIEIEYILVTSNKTLAVEIYKNHSNYDSWEWSLIGPNGNIVGA